MDPFELVALFSVVIPVAVLGLIVAAVAVGAALAAGEGSVGDEAEAWLRSKTAQE